MLNIDEILEKKPLFEKYCSVEKLYSLVDKLFSNRSFVVKEVGESSGGIPIYHIKFGRGDMRVLLLGCPHADEPIGSMSIYSLLKLLDDGCEELVEQNVEWHIIPCIDPDGVMLNEGWTQKPFTFERFMKCSFKQNSADQAERSLPLVYKDYVFDRPTTEAKALMDVIDSVRPDLYMALHNSATGGAYYLTSHDFGSEYYHKIYELLDNSGIPLKVNAEQKSFSGSYSRAVYGYPSSSTVYDFLATLVDKPSEFFDWGMSGSEYVRLRFRKAITFTSELSYIKHPHMNSEIVTDINYRQLKLKVDADNKYLFTVMIELWDKLEAHLNAESPFYKKMFYRITEAKKSLQDGVPEMQGFMTRHLLFSKGYKGKATEADIYNTYMTDRFYSLVYNYSFVRMLKESEKTDDMIQAIEFLDAIFDEALADMKSHVDFTLFEDIDLNELVSAQLGSSLVAIDYLIDQRRRVYEV